MSISLARRNGFLMTRAEERRHQNGKSKLGHHMKGTAREGSHGTRPLQRSWRPTRQEHGLLLARGSVPVRFLSFRRRAVARPSAETVEPERPVTQPGNGGLLPLAHRVKLPQIRLSIWRAAWLRRLSPLWSSAIGRAKQLMSVPLVRRNDSWESGCPRRTTDLVVRWHGLPILCPH